MCVCEIECLLCTFSPSLVPDSREVAVLRMMNSNTYLSLYLSLARPLPVGCDIVWYIFSQYDRPFRCYVMEYLLIKCWRACNLPRPFPYLGSVHRVFDLLRFLYLYSFLLHVFSYNITPPQFRSSYLSVSTYFHLNVLITTSSSVFLSHSLTISVSLLSFSNLCLPQLLLFLIY